jgi:transposase
MAKKQERKDIEKLKRAAYECVVIQDYTQEQAAKIVGVSTNTLSEWARKGNWKDLRKARQSAISTANNNLKNIISLLSEQRLKIEQKIHEAQACKDKEQELELRKQANIISDDLSKINKTLKENDKSNGITLGIYIDVMDDIFNNLRIFDLGLYNETIEFQAMLIQKKTIELG